MKVGYGPSGMFIDCPKVKTMTWMFSAGFFWQDVTVIGRNLWITREKYKAECRLGSCQPLGISEILEYTEWVWWDSEEGRLHLRDLTDGLNQLWTSKLVCFLVWGRVGLWVTHFQGIVQDASKASWIHGDYTSDFKPKTSHLLWIAHTLIMLWSFVQHVSLSSPCQLCSQPVHESKTVWCQRIQLINREIYWDQSQTREWCKWETVRPHHWELPVPENSGVVVSLFLADYR